MPEPTGRKPALPFSDPEGGGFLKFASCWESGEKVRGIPLAQDRPVIRTTISRILCRPADRARRSFLFSLAGDLREEMRLIPGGCPQRRSDADEAGGLFLLFCLAPHGVYRAPSIALGAVSSYLAFSPLPLSHRSGMEAVCFL